jgi:ankyrin repeat protein
MREMHSRVAQDMGMFYYPIHIAIKQDSINLIKLLLNYKQKFNIEIQEAYTKRTPLHIAAGKCSTEVLFILFNKNKNKILFR